jgi:hypothetical protein
MVSQVTVMVSESNGYGVHLLFLQLLQPELHAMNLLLHAYMVLKSHGYGVTE